MTADDEGALTLLELESWFGEYPPCVGLDNETCIREAEVCSVWEDSCEHVPEEILLCGEHKDKLEEAIAAGRIWQCRACRKTARVVAIEPLP